MDNDIDRGYKGNGRDNDLIAILPTVNLFQGLQSNLQATGTTIRQHAIATSMNLSKVIFKPSTKRPRATNPTGIQDSVDIFSHFEGCDKGADPDFSFHNSNLFWLAVILVEVAGPMVKAAILALVIPLPLRRLRFGILITLLVEATSYPLAALPGRFRLLMVLVSLYLTLSLALFHLLLQRLSN